MFQKLYLSQFGGDGVKATTRLALSKVFSSELSQLMVWKQNQIKKTGVEKFKLNGKNTPNVILGKISKMIICSNNDNIVFIFLEMICRRFPKTTEAIFTEIVADWLRMSSQRRN